MNDSRHPGLENYEQIEERFFNVLYSRLKDRIFLYVLTGSLAEGSIIPGWSDIDVLVGVDRHDRDSFAAVQLALEENKEPVKIGVTVLSHTEAAHPFLKPSRIYDVFSLIASGVYKPRIQNTEIFKIEEQLESTVRAANLAEFGFFLQFLKKGLMQGPDRFNEYEVHKYMTILLKILLREKGIKARSYADVAYNISAISDLPLVFRLPSEIVAAPESSADRFGLYLEFVQWIDKNSDALFR